MLGQLAGAMIGRGANSRGQGFAQQMNGGQRPMGQMAQNMGFGQKSQNTQSGIQGPSKMRTPDMMGQGQPMGQSPQMGLGPSQLPPMSSTPLMQGPMSQFSPMGPRPPGREGPLMGGPMMHEYNPDMPQSPTNIAPRLDDGRIHDMGPNNIPGSPGWNARNDPRARQQFEQMMAGGIGRPDVMPRTPGLGPSMMPEPVQMDENGLEPRRGPR